MDAPRPRSADIYSDSFMLHTVAPSYDQCKHKATIKNSKMLHMKTIDEIRYDNLQRLVRDAGGLSELVEKSGGKLNRPTLDQILKRRKTAAGVDKGVGDELARKIEATLRLERGWMDYSRDEQLSSNEVPLKPDGLIELITLFWQASDEGRGMILDSARIAPKLNSARVVQSTGN